MKLEDLEEKKYSELQALAKSVGIKANMKTEKLIEALLSAESEKTGVENVDHDKNQKPNQSDEKQDQPPPNFVKKEASTNKRRSSKRRGTYELECSVQELPEASAENSEVCTEEKEMDKDVNVESPINTTFDKSDLSPEKSKQQQKKNNKKQEKNKILQKDETIKTPLKKFSFAQKNPGSSRKDSPKGKSGISSKVKVAGGKSRAINESKIPTRKLNSGITKVKTPNFARIHQRQFEQMESLTDYVHKKQKLKDVASSAKKFTPFKVRTNLSVNFKDPDNSSAKKKFQKTPAPKLNGTGSVKATRFSSVIDRQPTLPKMDLSKSKLKPLTVKFRNVLRDSGNKLTTSAKKEVKFENKGRISGKFNLNQSKLPRLNIQEKHKNLRNAATETDTVSKIRKNQRVFVKGVRTNKRFELQMKMRMQNENSQI